MKNFHLPVFTGFFLFFLTGINSSAQEASPTIIHPMDINPLMEPFYHGVASGDPLTDRVILWTRVTPDTNSPATISVDWKIATDTNIAQVVNSGTVTTDASMDYTVKIDATGLQPNSVYYYQFTALGKNSVTGRTKTTPVGNVDSLRFAVVSCANYEAGFFNAYSAIKKGNDIDAVIMLGDYIYEYETGGYGPNGNAGRTWEPDSEIVTLADYRTRYSHYRLDKDLRQLHQQYPWIVVWDDHETANDSWEGGAENHDSTEGDWFSRKDAGIEAHHEWLPVRTFAGDTHRIYRTISYGDLLDLIMLDTRLEGRGPKVTGTSLGGYPVVDVTDPALNDTSRKIISENQYEWLLNRMDTTPAQWKMLGQQVMVGPLRLKPFPFGPTYAVNVDQWDGFPAQRQRFFDEALAKNIDNIVVLTGDIHTSWANDLPYVSGVSYDNSNTNAVAGSAGVEFVGTSVTSPGLPDALSAIVTPTTAKNNNPNIRYVELNKKGYVIVDINKNRTQGDFYYLVTIDSANSTADFETSWYVNAGERFLRQGSAKSVAGSSLTSIPFAPDEPLYVGIKENDLKKELVVFGVYPNPVTDYAVVQFYNEKNSNVKIKVMDVTGKLIRNENMGNISSGLHLYGIDLKNTSGGIYFLVIETENYTATQKLVKEK